MKINRYVVCLFTALALSTISFAAEQQWDGQHYAERASLQYRMAKQRIPQLELATNEAVLDIGAGDGRVSRLLAQAVPQGQVVGAEPASAMFTYANRQLSASPVNNLSFVQLNAEKLNYTEQFDRVVSFNAFHWIKDQAQALRTIERSLKPGGKVFLFFAPDHGRDRFDHAIDFVMSQPQWQAYFKNFSSNFVLVSPVKFASLMDQANLLLTRIEVVKIKERFENKQAFAHWIQGWMPHLTYLPKDKQHVFIDAVIDKYLEKYPLGEQGVLVYHDYWLEVEAEKFSG